MPAPPSEPSGHPGMTMDRPVPRPKHDVPARPLVVEIMGPAAAGKTSLVRTLRERDERIRAGLRVPRVRWLPFVVAKVVSLFPIWVIRYRKDRWFTWNEMKSMAFLDAWLRATKGPIRDGVRATVIDHGPVYRLARLGEFGPSVTRTERFQRWWRATLEGWLDGLDLIVSLDAPDGILLDRVEQRGHWFLSADRPAGEKEEFLARFRTAFARTLEAGGTDGPRVVHVRTDRFTVEQIAEQVLDAIRADAPEPERHEETPDR